MRRLLLIRGRARCGPARRRAGGERGDGARRGDRRPRLGRLRRRRRVRAAERVLPERAAQGRRAWRAAPGAAGPTTRARGCCPSRRTSRGACRSSVLSQVCESGKDGTSCLPLDQRAPRPAAARSPWSRARPVPTRRAPGALCSGRMRVGVAREIKPQEYRVALTPAGALELVRAGHDVVVEAGAGAGSGFADEAYAAVGARARGGGRGLGDCRPAAQGEGAGRGRVPTPARGPDALHVPPHRRRRAADARRSSTRGSPRSPTRPSRPPTGACRCWRR